ncbi:hypothetical protein [Flectobacillus major]|uniref:hypothetical protein n=1 Tax=Flectobacillus major TaxID=103 RepID=UPI000413BCD8|nr:hypothetical protein [Flectobacillus major]
MKIPFRTINYSIDPSIVGVKGGMGNSYLSDDFFKKNVGYSSIFLRRESKWWNTWSNWQLYGSDLVEVDLEKRGRLTDFIKPGKLLRGFFVNNKLRNILEKSILPNHHFFEVTFNQSGKIIDGYWWFCFDYETGEQNIDFSKCEYDLSFHLRNINKDFNPIINTYSDYINIVSETDAAIKTTKLVFNSNFNSDIDIFGTQFLTNDIYISEKLYHNLREQNVTGYRVEYPIVEMEFNYPVH